MKIRHKKKSVGIFDICGSTLKGHQLTCLTDAATRMGFFDGACRKQFRVLRRRLETHDVSFENYDRELVDLFVANIIGKSRADFEKVCSRVFRQKCDSQYLFTRQLIKRIKPTHRLVTITGGMEELAKHFAQYWGFEFQYSSVLEVDEAGNYTGRDLKVPVLNKGLALVEHMTACKLCTLEDSIGLGDTGSDILFLEKVQRPIAFKPSRKLLLAARERDWTVVYETRDNITVRHGNIYEDFGKEEVESAIDFALSLPKQKLA